MGPGGGRRGDKCRDAEEAVGIIDASEDIRNSRLRYPLD